MRLTECVVVAPSPQVTCASPGHSSAVPVITSRVGSPTTPATRDAVSNTTSWAAMPSELFTTTCTSYRRPGCRPANACVSSCGSVPEPMDTGASARAVDHDRVRRRRAARPRP